MSILDRSSGVFSNTTSIPVTRSTGSFGSGTVIVIAIAGNTTITTPGSATSRASSVLNMGFYAYDLAGTGQSSIAVTAGASGSGQWFSWELSSSSAFVDGQASQVGTSETQYATPSITPTVGDRHMLAVAGGLGNGNARNISSWTNSFVEWADAQATVQDWPFAGAADVDVTASGSTAYTSTAVFSAITSSGAGGITLAYSVAAAPSTPVGAQLLVRQAVNRSYTY